MERTRGARSAVVLGGVVAAAALSVTAWQPASAAPQADTAQADTAQAAELPPGLKDAVRRDLGISPQEYLERAHSARAVAGESQRLRNRDPQAFGAAWLAQDGTPIIAVTTATAAQEVRDAGFTPALVPATAKDSAPRTAAPRVLQLKASPIGGDEYITGAGPIAQWPGYTSCSLGFTAVDSAGEPYAISAGHCDPEPAAAGIAGASGVYLHDAPGFRDSTRIGRFDASTLSVGPEYLDYSVIAIDSGAPGSLAEPQVHGSGADRLAITGVASPAVVGTPVCKSGASSAYTCGEVLAADETVPVEDADGVVVGRVRGFITSVCTLSGDSGGPMFSGTAALGIVSASDFEDPQGCGIAPSGDDGPMTIGVPVRKILDAVNAGPGEDLALRTASNPGPPIPAGDGGGGVPGVPAGSLASVGAS
ncbi:S1 family peptidase [Tomitella fengzijianii]|uniref:Peptidase n=1 Tax=Tomitella fengzijianii TaxID=2597660 RepID=A0A516WZI4_9ACTN|nr:S1 family peptidase [Tomitella fengzijianii]QDQ96170.1 peptidase [Tomitella fengzijianii]